MGSGTSRQQKEGPQQVTAPDIIYARDIYEAQQVAGGRVVYLDLHRPTFNGRLPFIVEHDDDGIAVDCEELYYYAGAAADIALGLLLAGIAAGVSYIVWLAVR